MGGIASASKIIGFEPPLATPHTTDELERDTDLVGLKSGLQVSGRELVLAA